MNKIEVYCDGAYSSSRKQGGYAFVVIKDNEKIYQEFLPLTGGTNNTAEIYAALEACKWCKHYGFNDIIIYTDSMYVIGAVSLGNKRNANIDLLKKLDKVIDGIGIEWKHVKGHEGNKFNELCDVLAVTASHLEN